MILSAPFVIPLYQDIIVEGAVLVKENKIIETGKRRELREDYPREEERYLEQGLLMPGLINSHTSLELGSLRNLLPHYSSFSRFDQQLQQARARLSREELINAVRLGVLESLSTGTTCVADHSSSGASFQLLFNERIRSQLFLDMEGVKAESFTEYFHLLLSRAAGFSAGSRCHWGLCPDSPFRCHPSLYKICRDYCQEHQILLATRAAASQEEWEMFTGLRGDLYASLDPPSRQLIVPGQGGPVNFLFRQNLLSRRSLLIHACFFSDEELAQIRQEEISVVFCPVMYDYFGAQNRSLPRLLQAGVNVCLGTSSLAYADSLNMFEAMYKVTELFPDIPALEIIKMATIRGARALGIGENVGLLAPGYTADIIGLSLKEMSLPHLYEQIIQQEQEVKMVMVDGEVVYA
jgi:5-methylthioadenosine/S-adenosylhomocysteine deaminase